MADVTAALVKELRERTGLGMMECKKALVAAGADIELAIDTLRKESGLKAAKKAGRIAAEGIVLSRTQDGFAVVVEINSETDFVARDDNFLAFANKVADAALATKETDVAALMANGLESEREALVQKIGENISVRRVVTLEAPVVGAYVHGGRIGVLVGLSAADVDVAKDVAMHVAAVNPLVLSAEQVDADTLERERQVVIAQSEGSGKPAEIIAKMVEGRLKKFIAEISLVEQPFIKNPDQKVGEFAKAAGADVLSFSRIEVGEGIEKEEVDFAAEVAAAAGFSK